MSQLDFTHPQETIGTGVDIDMSQDKHLNFFVFLTVKFRLFQTASFLGSFSLLKKKGEKVTHAQKEKKREKKKKKEEKIGDKTFLYETLQTFQGWKNQKEQKLSQTFNLCKECISPLIRFNLEGEIGGKIPLRLLQLTPSYLTRSSHRSLQLQIYKIM